MVRFQRRGEHVIHGLGKNEFHRLFDFIRYIVDILRVTLRKDHRFEPVSMGGQDFFLDSPDR